MPNANERRKAWSNLMRAVHEGKRGNYGPARQIVEAVRAKHGDMAADSQRRELWRMIQTGEKKT